MCDHLGYIVHGLFKSKYKWNTDYPTSVIQIWSWSNFGGLNMIYEALMAFFFNYHKKGGIAKDLSFEFSCFYWFCITRGNNAVCFQCSLTAQNLQLPSPAKCFHNIKLSSLIYNKLSTKFATSNYIGFQLLFGKIK